jgi:hypothetical protein
MVMAIRRRQVHPDEILTLRDGREIPVVSDEAWLGALLEMGRVVSIAGGTLSATVLRHPTDLDGEMVTVGAVLEWKDRTDARPQPEPGVRPTPEMERALNPELRGLTALATSEEVLSIEDDRPQPEPASAPPSRSTTTRPTSRWRPRLPRPCRVMAATGRARCRSSFRRRGSIPRRG